MSREFSFSIPQLMRHRAHAITDKVKQAVKQAGNTERKRGRRKGELSLQDLVVRLDRLSLVAEKSGSASDAIKGLAECAAILKQMRDTGDVKRPIEIRLNYHDSLPTNPRPKLIQCLKLYLDTKPDPDVAMHASALLGLLEPAGASSKPIQVFEGPRSLQ